jgi:ubiquitin carboxyl-terminal hydrolase 4/11/15
MYLSVPLPITKERVVETVVFRADTSIPPLRYGVRVDKKGKIQELKTSLATLCDIKDESSIITMELLSNSRFRRVYGDNDRIDFISDNEIIFAFETKPNPEDVEMVSVFVVNRKSDNSQHSSSNLFGTPMVMTIPVGITYRQLYKELLNNMKFFLPEVPSTEIELAGKEDSSESSSDDHFRHKPIKIDPNPKYGAIFNIIPADDNGTPKSNKKFKNDDQPLKIKDGYTICCSWSSENKSKYYKSYDIKEFETHPSCKSSKVSDELNLENCLQLFNAEEQLGPNDTWYCGECKDHKQAFKKFDIWTMPSILVIHLKRFSYYRGVFREKLESFVDFPHDLDLTGKVKSCDSNTPLVYELYAISNHFGGLGGGHYTAYCKHRDGKWYQYDDSHVSEVSSESVKTRSAYVLFYKKKGLEFTPFNAEWDNKKIESSSSDSADSDDECPLVEYMNKNKPPINQQNPTPDNNLPPDNNTTNDDQEQNNTTGPDNNEKDPNDKDTEKTQGPYTGDVPEDNNGGN